MVGLERTVLPLVAQADFGLASQSVVLSFLVSFGIVKALANVLAGGLADRVGRKRIEYRGKTQQLVLRWKQGGEALVAYGMQPMTTQRRGQ